MFIAADCNVGGFALKQTDKAFFLIQHVDFLDNLVKILQGNRLADIILRNGVEFLCSQNFRIIEVNFLQIEFNGGTLFVGSRFVLILDFSSAISFVFCDLIVITNKSIFSLIRVQIAPQVLTDNNKAALLEFVNEENTKYKPLKLYFNANGTLLLDLCLTNVEDQLNGDTIYLIFDVIINYLNDNYQKIMKAIWS